MENDSTIFQNPQGIWALTSKVVSLTKEFDAGYVTYTVDGREYAAIFSQDHKWSDRMEEIIENRVRRNIAIKVSGLFTFRASYVTIDKGYGNRYELSDMITNEFYTSKLTYGMWAVFMPGLRNNIEHHMMMIIMAADNANQ